MTEPTGDERETQALVRRARDGDAAVFERLARRFYGRVHRWALIVTADPDDAADVAQEVLLRVHRGLGGYDGRAAFATWLYRVTRNAALEWRRRSARRDEVAARWAREAERQVGGGPAALGRLHEARVAGLVRTFFAELPPRQREIFDLVDLQGWKPAEAAEMLEMKPVTVRANLLKARRAIRRKILEMNPELMEE